MISRPTRLQLSPPVAFWLAAAIAGLALFASATPTPLYGDYAARWHFSTTTLTLVYAVYAVGVLAMLLLIGRLSDDLGRRPVLLGGLAVLVVAIVLFMLADSVAWLFAARTLQGLSTGVLLGASSAALLDLEPRGNASQAALVSGAVATFGLGGGAFASALLVQYAPAPFVTPYAFVLVLLAIVLAGTLALPETVQERGRLRLRVERPAVPRSMRREFALASGGVLASWSVGGLYLALAPSLTRGLLGSTSHVAGGIAVLALTGSGALTQILLRRMAAERAMRLGTLGLAASVLALAATLTLHSGAAAAFLVVSVLVGVGWGLAFMGALRIVSTTAPPEHRAAVMSAFFVVAYGALSVPAVLAGVIANGSGLEPTFRAFAVAVAALALVTALAGRRAQRLPLPQPVGG